MKKTINSVIRSLVLFMLIIMVSCNFSKTNSTSVPISYSATETQPSGSGQVSFYTPTNGSKDQSDKNQIFDFMINGVPADHNLLFFSLSKSDNLEGINFYSANTQTGDWNCLSCNLNLDKSNVSLQIRLPPGLSVDHQNLAIQGEVFEGTPDNNQFSGLWLVNLRKGGIRVIQSSNKFIGYSFPVWSPDDSKIASFTDDGHVNIINVSNGEQILPLNSVTQWKSETDQTDFDRPSMDLSWSPDGKYFIYNTLSAYPVRVNFNTLTARILSPFNNNKARIYFPAFSPAGTQILFSSDALNRNTGLSYDQWSLNPKISVYAFSATDLFIMNIDGNEEHCLTCGNVPGLVFAPSWSPDGKHIVFFDYDLSHFPDIFENIDVIDTDGANMRNLARFPSNGPGDYVDYKISGPPSWSVDGKQIAFSALNGGNQGIYVVNVDGSDLRLVVSQSGQDFVFPLWLDK